MNGTSEKEKDLTAAQQAIDLVSSNLLFRDQFNEAFIIVSQGDHDENIPLNSRRFKTWLAGEYYQTFNKPINPALTSTIALTLEARAENGTAVYPLANRVTKYNGAIYYDLKDKAWRVVRILPGKWEITASPRPLFRRYKHMQAQVEPKASKHTLTDFIKMFKIKTDDDKLLLNVWLVSCFVPDIPHTILVFHGQQGATKSFWFKLARQLIDPSVLELISFPKDAGELKQKLSHHYASFFDNVSYIGLDASDNLCRACTGEGFSKRALYTNDDDFIYKYKRCIGLNGINVAPQKPDLLDRCMLIGFERLTEDERKKEETLLQMFDEIKPGVLAYIFDTLAKALEIKKELNLSKFPRMADWAEWGEAISRAMGNAPNAFLQAYARNIGLQHSEAIQASLVGQALLAFIEKAWPKKDSLTDYEERKQEWVGTPSELLSQLEEIAEESKINTRSKYWPKAPNKLSRDINELKTNLQELGIHVENIHTGEEREIKLWKENTVSCVSTVGTNDDNDISHETVSQTTANTKSIVQNNDTNGANGTFIKENTETAGGD